MFVAFDEDDDHRHDADRDVDAADGDDLGTFGSFLSDSRVLLFSEAPLIYLTCFTFDCFYCRLFSLFFSLPCVYFPLSICIRLTSE